MTDTPPPPVAGTDARETTRELSEAELDAFQERVRPWLLACFGEMIAGDREERNHRFLEEALELVQSCGCTASEAHQLVDYTFGRPAGDQRQECGGVMVTLAALCLANGLDMHAEAETELTRIWTCVEKIRAKQAAKPKHSPLPEAVSSSLTLSERTLERIEQDARSQTPLGFDRFYINLPTHEVLALVAMVRRAKP